MNPNDNRPIENLLEGLSHHAQFLTREERKDELRERGIDVDGFLKEAHSIIESHLKNERLAWMKTAEEKSRQLLAKDVSLVSWIGKNADEIAAAFQQLITNASPQHTLAFRKKGDLTTEDMARILDDYERLRKTAVVQKSSEAKT